MTADVSHQQLYAAHCAHMQKHWESILEQSGYEAVLVHSGTPIVSFQDDYEYAFRPNPNFLAWLPLTRHADSSLLVTPSRKPSLYYHQPDDYWYRPPSDPESWWADQFEIHTVREDGASLTGALERVTALSLNTDRVAVIGDSPALSRHFRSSQINPTDLVTAIHLLRTRKTPYEISCMEQASRMGARGHVAAEDAFRRGESEFGIHLTYLQATALTDPELPYANIVALNEHGAVLHYHGNERTVPAEVRSFLIDAGCTVHAYASDITRSYAARKGEFEALIDALEIAQQALCERVVAGLDFGELHLDAHHRIAGILAECGIIRCSAEAAVANGLSSVFLPHGLGHFIGLQTHDVAGRLDNEGRTVARPEGHPFLRLTRTLEPGNVLTIEPGLYFIEPLLRRWKENGDAQLIDWRAVERLSPFGGIRIEDDVLVTEEGRRNLTREAFDALEAGDGD